MSDGDENGNGHGHGANGPDPYGRYGPQHQHQDQQSHQPGFERPAPWPVAGEQPTEGWGGGYDVEATGFVQLPPGGIPGVYGPDGWSAPGGAGSPAEPAAYDDPLGGPLAAPGTGQGGYTPPTLGPTDVGGTEGGSGLGAPSGLPGPDVAGLHGAMGPVGMPGAPGAGAPAPDAYGDPYASGGAHGPGAADQWSMPFGAQQGPGAGQSGGPGGYEQPGAQEFAAGANAGAPEVAQPGSSWQPEPGAGHQQGVAGEPSVEDAGGAAAMGQGAAAALAGSHEARTQRRPLGSGGAAREADEADADAGDGAVDPHGSSGSGSGFGPHGRPDGHVPQGRPGQLPPDEGFLADAHARRQVPFEGHGESAGTHGGGAGPDAAAGPHGASGAAAGAHPGGAGDGGDPAAAGSGAGAAGPAGGATGDPGSGESGGFAGLGTVRSGLPWAPSTPSSGSAASASAAHPAGPEDTGGGQWQPTEPNPPASGAGWTGEKPDSGAVHATSGGGDAADAPETDAEANAPASGTAGPEDAQPAPHQPSGAETEPQAEAEDGTPSSAGQQSGDTAGSVLPGAPRELAEPADSGGPDPSVEHGATVEAVEPGDAAESGQPDGPGEPGDPNEDAQPDEPVRSAGDEHPRVSYVLHVNGVDRPVTDAWIGESLLYVLRERLGLAGAKDGCSQGECGACSVQVDGRLVASCLVPAATSAGCEIRTVEGLAVDGAPSDVQRALTESGAVQCGFCVPGLAMTVQDLLEGNHAPSELETRQAISGNLCRCSGYRGVLDAVRAVVAERAERAARAEAEAEEEADQHGAQSAGQGEPWPGPPDDPAHPPRSHPHIPDQAADPGVAPDQPYGYDHGYEPYAYGAGVPEQSDPVDQYGQLPASPNSEPARIPHQTGPGMWGGYGPEGGGT